MLPILESEELFFRKVWNIKSSAPKKALLAIVFVLKKFEKFLLGRKCTLMTYNESIVSSIKQYSIMV